MKTKIQIKSLWGSVLFEFEKEDNTIKDTLIEAVKSEANLSRANLSEANLSEANLSRAYLKKIIHLFTIIPEKGSFIGWKKGQDNCIIELEIPKEAKRHNYLGGRKCRAEFVKVIEIRDSKGHKVKECYNGTNDNKILYKVGEMVYPDKYDPNPLNECSNGIHFFITRQEAKEWQTG